jgi:Mg-chelatase subunit ChlD
MRCTLTIALLLALAAPALADPSPPPVRVVIESPRSGERVENKVDQAPIRGSAVASGERPAEFDVMVVIDVSGSTDEPSGVDVDGNGVVGVDPRLELMPPGSYPEDLRNTDPGDSILQAEAAAARALIKGLDPKRVRVGLVTFAGEVDPTTGERRSLDQQDAWLEVPLTSDFAQVREAIDAIVARGAHGATNFAAGIRAAVTELAGLPGSHSRPRPHAKPGRLFLTDGVPSFPIGRGDRTDPGDIEAAISAAKLAKEAGIVINTYALGPEALSYPQAVTEMARVSLGTYTPVQSPGNIIALLQGVSFANIEDVVVTNLTTGDFSTDVRLNPDGSFVGFVPVREGRNQVRVTALASDGTRGSATVELEFGKAALSDRELALQLEQIRRVNKELTLLRERKRIDEFRSKEKKELELQVEKPKGGPSN